MNSTSYASKGAPTLVAKDPSGNYFVAYILQNPPAKVDGTVWSVAVSDYLTQAGVTSVTANTTVANVDFPAIRRTYNRLLGEGKQRRSVNSTEAPEAPVVATERKP